MNLACLWTTKLSVIGILIISILSQSTPSLAQRYSDDYEVYQGSDAFGTRPPSEQSGFNNTSRSTSQPSQSPTSRPKTNADGRLTMRNYVSGDTSQTYNSPQLYLSFLEADLHLKDITSSGLSLDLDSTFILDISQANERRFGETERFDQVRQLILTQEFDDLTLSFGRRLISESGNAWVDGVDLKYHFNQKHTAIGLYGGLSPDRFDRSLTVDYQALGLYIDYQKRPLSLSLAYNLILFQGKLDRQFLYQRTHYKIAEGLFATNYLILDFVDEPQITTFLGTLDYTPIKSLNLTVNLSQYSLEQYRNQTIYRDIIEPNQALILGNEVINLSYQRLRFSGAWWFNSELRSYLSTELKSRAQDGRKAYIYTAGLNHSNVLNSKLDLDLQLQIAQNFRTDTIIVALSLRRDLGTRFSVDGRLSSFSGELLDDGTDRQVFFKEAQRIFLFGLSAIGRITRSHQVLATYDGVYESEIADYKSDEAMTIHTLSFFYSYLY